MSVRTRKLLELAVEIAVPIALVALIWAYTESSDTFYYPPLGDVFEPLRRHLAVRALRLRRLAEPAPDGVRLRDRGRDRRSRPASRSAPRARCASATAPIVEFLRSIPPPALIPFAIVVIGVGDDMKVFIIGFVCLWPVLLNTIDGINGIDPTLKDTARVYGISGRDKLLRMTLPAASPQIFAGMRLSLSLALILMVISEMVASTNGIGFFVLQSQRSFAIPEMWSGILLLGILGYVFNLVFMIIERRVLAWHRGARASSLG